MEFGTYSINAMHPKTRKILQLLRLRQVLHETHPLWYYKMATGYCSFYLCFCVGHDDKYILLKAKAGSDYLLIVPGSFSESTRFLSYLSLSSLGHSLQIFEPKLKHLVSRCLGVCTFFILTFQNFMSIKYTLFLIGLLLNSLKLEAHCCECYDEFYQVTKF